MDGGQPGCRPGGRAAGGSRAAIGGGAVVSSAGRIVIWTFWMFCLLTPIILFYTFYNHGKKSIYLVFILLICFCVTDLIHLHMFKNFFERLRPCWDEGVAPLSRIVIGKGGQSSKCCTDKNLEKCQSRNSIIPMTP